MHRPSDFLTLLKHAARLYRGLGWRRTAILHAVGMANSLLMAVGLSALLPVLSIVLYGQSPEIQRFVTPLVRNGLAPASALDNPGSWLCFGLLGMFLLRSMLLSVYYGIGGYWIESHTARFRNRLVSSIVRCSESDLEGRDKADSLHLNSQLQSFTSFNWGLIYVTLLLYLALLILVTIAILSPKTFLAAFGLAAVLVPLVSPVMRATASIGRKLFDVQQRINTRLHGFLEGLETLTVLGLRAQEMRAIGESGRELARRNRSLGLLQGMIAGLPEVIVAVVSVVVVVLLGTGDINGALFATFGYAAVRFVGTLTQIAERLNELFKIQHVATTLYRMTDELPRDARDITDLGEQPKAISPLPDGPSVVFDQVRIVSASHRPLLNLGRLTLSAPGIWQIVGPNGSGKSLLVRSLLRLVPFQGTITIDGRDTRTMLRGELNSWISYQGQHGFLREGSVADNLLLGHRQATEEDAERLFAAIEIDPFVAFPGGFSARVAEGGRNLSGGQRQLICITRALLRDSPIYILDEFTNHLSRDVTEKLLRYLERIHGRLILLVSHHIHVGASRAVRMEEGEVLEDASASHVGTA